MMVIAAEDGFPASAGGIEVWRQWADDVSLATISGTGHFLQEENPDAVASALIEFMGGSR